MRDNSLITDTVYPLATLFSKLKKERGLKKRRESRASNAPERLSKMKLMKCSFVPRPSSEVGKAEVGLY